MFFVKSYYKVVNFAAVKKLFSISFSFVILIQSMGINIDDVVQIGNFYEHAKFHNEKYGDNVFVFISKHYGKLKATHEKDHKEEKNTHKQLPFQHNIQTSLVAVFVPQKQIKSNSTFYFLESNSNKFHYQSSNSTLHVESLLQPPRQS